MQRSRFRKCAKCMGLVVCAVIVGIWAISTWCTPALGVYWHRRGYSYVNGHGINTTVARGCAYVVFHGPVPGNSSWPRASLSPVAPENLSPVTIDSSPGPYDFIVTHHPAPEDLNNYRPAFGGLPPSARPTPVASKGIRGYRFTIRRSPHWMSTRRWMPGLTSGRPPRMSRMLIMPLWLPLVAFAGTTAWLWKCDRPPHNHCQSCAYNLTGNMSGVCPECGTKR